MPWLLAGWLLLWLAGSLGLAAWLLARLIAVWLAPVPTRLPPPEAPGLWVERPPEPRRVTVWTWVRELARGATVLTPSTPYRFRIERVLWVEKQPLGGPVVAALEGQDPETLQLQQRWHKWDSDEHVIVFTADVDPFEGTVGASEREKLYDRFAADKQPRPEPVEEQQEEEDLWQSAPELTFP